jgi:hypothetical protein
MERFKYWFIDRLLIAGQALGEFVGKRLENMMEGQFYSNNPKTAKVLFYVTLRVICFIGREKWDDHKDQFDEYYKELSAKNTKLNRYLGGKQ